MAKKMSEEDRWQIIVRSQISLINQKLDRIESKLDFLVEEKHKGQMSLFDYDYAGRPFLKEE